MTPKTIKRLSSDFKDAAKDEFAGHQEICDGMQVEKTSPGAKYYFSVVRYGLTGVLLPLFDIRTDLVTAYTHFSWGDRSWGILTLFFVALPGIVCGLAFLVLGLQKE